jgi:hypothetical protein
MIEHFYVYYGLDNDWIYERTCGTLEAAQDRIYELLKYYKVAFFRRNEIMEGAYY